MVFKQREKKYAKYENDEFFQRWLTGLSLSTQEHYAKEIVDWITFVGMTPTEQIHKRMHDLTSTDLTERTFFEVQFTKYKQFLENKGNLKPLAVRTQLTAVASFFSRNNLPLALKKGDWASTAQQAVIQRFRLAKDDLQTMYRHGNLRDRALLLVLGQSGISEVDTTVLKIEDFPELYTIPEGEHLFFEKPREKTNEIQATCLSAEAIHDIRAMLAERGSPTKGLLFTGQTKSKNSQLEVRTINDAMKALAHRSLSKEKAKEFKTKGLRSFYNSALLRANIKPEIKDLMMGHARLGARGHYDYDEETIVTSYKAAFEVLSVNGIQTKNDLAKLKTDYEATKKELLKCLAEQQTELQDLKEQLNENYEFVHSNLNPVLDIFHEIAKTPEGQELIRNIRQNKETQERIETEEIEKEVRKNEK